MSEKTVHEKLARALHRGTGIRLSAEEVWELVSQEILDIADADIECRDIEAKALEDAKRPKPVPPIVRKPQLKTVDEEGLEEWTLEELMEVR